MSKDRSDQCHKPKQQRVDLSERQKQGNAEPPRENRDALGSIGEEFERTIDSGDPFESLTRSTKRLWRGLID